MNKETKKLLLTALVICLIIALLYVIVTKLQEKEQENVIDLPVVSDSPLVSWIFLTPGPTNTSTYTPSPSNPVISFDYSELPNPETYEGTEAWVLVNNNQPFFTDEEKHTNEIFEIYANLDDLGRCGTAYANICIELMPTEPRGNIGSVKPTGWQSTKYDTSIVDGGYLYNRCHLIGFQLAGENANKLNLITGTRYLNIKGMLPFENMVTYAVKTDSIHVLYRVTPIFRGNNLVADGVLMEGYSIEDAGETICFCVFALNIQPGITIDYATGLSELN